MNYLQKSSENFIKTIEALNSQAEYNKQFGYIEDCALTTVNADNLKVEFEKQYPQEFIEWKNKFTNN